MKGLTKTLVALVLVMTLVATMGMSALAANYSTKTTYLAENKISVKATATGLEKGDKVTYVATTDEENINEQTIVYINQDEADSNGKAEFSYTTSVTNINATMLFGGSKESIAQPADPIEDYAINVYLNGEDTGRVVYAAKQETADLVVIRKFDITGIANFSANKIKSVKFGETEIVDYSVDETRLFVYTNAINGNGILYIETEGAAWAKPQISAAATTVTPDGNLVAVAKAPVGNKFGIVIYQDEADVVIDGTAKIGTGYVVLPALGKNVDGIFAVEFEDIASVLSAPFNVKAYAYDGSAYVLSDTAAEIQ